MNNPNDAERILRGYFNTVSDDHERMVALRLNGKYAVLGLVEVALGGSASTVVLQLKRAEVVAVRAWLVLVGKKTYRVRGT